MGMRKSARECMTTVKELIALLQKEDPERVVVLSKDGEGNGFSPFSDFGHGAYEPDSTYSGELGIEKLTDKLKEQGYTEEDVCDGIPALVLWPIN